PPWALGAPLDFINTLARLTGLQFRAQPEPEPVPDEASAARTIRRAVEQLIQPQRATIIPRGSHTLLDGVRSVAAQSEYPASRWTAQATGSLALELGDSQAINGNDVAEPAIWL